MVKRTPLYDMHIKYGGRIVEFAGYELPIQYSGIKVEHLAVRKQAGLFDVSHMGEIIVSGEGALATINYLLTNDFTNMKDGQVKYSMMLYPNGTIIDDVLVYKIAQDNYLIVVNASNREKDYQWIQDNKLKNTSITDLSDYFAQIALQGPLAEEVMRKLMDISLISDKSFTFTKDVDFLGSKCIISRTGYTGEKGFEIYSNIDDIENIFEKIVNTENVTLCGLGARDTLRLEAGMPLYGHELSENILATETGLDIFIKMNKEFIGKNSLLNKKPNYKRIGLILTDRGIAREGNKVYIKDKEIGYITSGTMSPLTNKAIAMARVSTDFCGKDLVVDVRGRKLKAEVTTLPFNKK